MTRPRTLTWDAVNDWAESHPWAMAVLFTVTPILAVVAVGAP